MVLLNTQHVQSEDDIQGNSKPMPGRYHAIISQARECGSKKKGTPGLEVDFQVLAGTNPGEIGKSIGLFMSFVGEDEKKTKTCLDRVTRFALCAGVIQPGQNVEPNWDEAIGRELVIEIEAQEYETQSGEKRQGSQVAFLGFWSLGNKAVADVPRDEDSPGMSELKSAGKWPPKDGAGQVNQAAAESKPTTKPTSQPAKTTPAPSTNSTAPKGKWSDL